MTAEQELIEKRKVVDRIVNLETAYSLDDSRFDSAEEKAFEDFMREEFNPKELLDIEPYYADKALAELGYTADDVKNSDSDLYEEDYDKFFELFMKFYFEEIGAFVSNLFENESFLKKHTLKELNEYATIIINTTHAYY